MEPFWGEWLLMAMNVVVIALIVTIPLLIGILIIWLLRRGISTDRWAFEGEIRSKLTDLANSQAEIERKLDELLNR